VSPIDEQNQRIAEKLRLSVNEVMTHRAALSEALELTVIRAIFADKLNEALTEQLRKLRKASPSETQKVQGHADGLEAAITQINEKL
jgi:hypothetical protein